ncbi:putative asialoglycoprotein receptor 2-like isoform X4 [Apostichopus japonicus]|uniref:Putative asialoglycoprotein receptor 2-like isoform X4 n=2 Tax=Stichopus japonicus TaxID=307972 RepID=A0A2G8LBU2_STIJA|nr:putative asialoglycoprotein receptor 2-like isoform X4 [Apostichopus japonicus]
MDKLTTWDQAETNCMTSNSHLLTLYTASERDDFKSNLWNTLNIPDDAELWLGFKEGPAGKYVDVNGAPIEDKTTSWERGEPKDVPGSVDCAITNTAGQWWAKVCSNAYRYVCQTLD